MTRPIDWRFPELLDACRQPSDLASNTRLIFLLDLGGTPGLALLPELQKTVDALRTGDRKAALQQLDIVRARTVPEKPAHIRLATMNARMAGFIMRDCWKRAGGLGG